MTKSSSFLNILRELVHDREFLQHCLKLYVIIAFGFAFFNNKISLLMIAIPVGIIVLGVITLEIGAFFEDITDAVNRAKTKAAGRKA